MTGGGASRCVCGPEILPSSRPLRSGGMRPRPRADQLAAHRTVSPAIKLWDDSVRLCWAWSYEGVRASWRSVSCLVGQCCVGGSGGKSHLASASRLQRDRRRGRGRGTRVDCVRCSAFGCRRRRIHLLAEGAEGAEGSEAWPRNRFRLNLRARSGLKCGHEHSRGAEFVSNVDWFGFVGSLVLTDHTFIHLFIQSSSRSHVLISRHSPWHAPITPFHRIA